MKNKLYICTYCSFQKLDEPNLNKKCEKCLDELKNTAGIEPGTLLEVSVAATSAVKEKTNVPGFGPANLLYSLEAMQDLMVQQEALKKYRASEPSHEEIEMWNKIAERGVIGSVRTPEPTIDEINDWKYYHTLFSHLTLDKLTEIKEKYQVKFFRDDWYNEEYGDECEDDPYFQHIYKKV